MVKNINLLFSKRNKKAASVVAAAEAGIINANYGSKRIDELEPGDLIKIAESISNVYSI
jgi:hypothetical protein